MYTIGIDIGSLTTKILLLKNNSILGWEITSSGTNYKVTGKRLYEKLLNKYELSPSEISTIVSTGYGRHSIINITSNHVTEISAHTKGAQFYFPKVQGVVDIGGQDSKVIKINPHSKQFIDFQMNDKCAAGTGRFLEVMASALNVEIDQFGDLVSEAKEIAKISSTCTVFAESEVIGLFAQGIPKPEIAAGIHHSIAKRISNMVQRVNLTPPVMFSGGVALNQAMKSVLESYLNYELLLPPNPQIIGALGAAVIAHERELKKTKKT